MNWGTNYQRQAALHHLKQRGNQSENFTVFELARQLCNCSPNKGAYQRRGPIASFIVRHPTGSCTFSGLTWQVGQCMLDGLWGGGVTISILRRRGGGSCSPFFTGGYVLKTLFPKPNDGGGRRTHSVSALLLV